MGNKKAEDQIEKQKIEALNETLRKLTIEPGLEIIIETKSGLNNKKIKTGIFAGHFSSLSQLTSEAELAYSNEYYVRTDINPGKYTIFSAVLNKDGSINQASHRLEKVTVNRNEVARIFINLNTN